MYRYSKATLALRVNGKSSSKAGTRDGNPSNLVTNDYDAVGYHADLTLDVVPQASSNSDSPGEAAATAAATPFPHFDKEFPVESLTISYDGPAHHAAATPSKTSALVPFSFHLGRGTFDDDSTAELFVNGTAPSVPWPFRTTPITAYCKVYVRAAEEVRGREEKVLKDKVRAVQAEIALTSC